MHRARYDHPEPYTDKGSDSLCHVFVTGPCCMQHSFRTFKIGKRLYEQDRDEEDKRPEEVMPNRYELIRINPDTLTASVFLRRYSFERRYEDGRWGAWTTDTDPGFVDPYGCRPIAFRASATELKSRAADKLGIARTEKLPKRPRR
jgi:hypothetical protein